MQRLLNLGLTTVTVEYLIICYPDLVNGFYEAFETIKNRKNTIGFQFKVFDEKGLFDKQMRIMGGEALGGLDAVKEIITSANRAGSSNTLISRHI